MLSFFCTKIKGATFCGFFVVPLKSIVSAVKISDSGKYQTVCKINTLKFTRFIKEKSKLTIYFKFKNKAF